MSTKANTPIKLKRLGYRGDQGRSRDRESPRTGTGTSLSQPPMRVPAEGADLAAPRNSDSFPEGRHCHAITSRKDELLQNQLMDCPFPNDTQGDQHFCQNLRSCPAVEPDSSLPRKPHSDQGSERTSSRTENPEGDSSGAYRPRRCGDDHDLMLRRRERNIGSRAAGR
jgi:hypothetical protein